jgi:hypothetical protein
VEAMKVEGAAAEHVAREFTPELEIYLRLLVVVRVRSFALFFILILSFVCRFLYYCLSRECLLLAPCDD